jgi:C4-dicarboxylate-specific signal transduction histidine kinase
LLAQVGLIVVIEVVANPDLNLTTYQGMMLVLAVTGLAVGITVTERRRAEQQLLVQQDAQARIKRLGSIGELAAALTHEINQPLAAATTYSRLAVEALEDPEPSVDAAHDAAMKAATQLDRTVRVVKELREFIQLGRSHVVPVDAHSVIRETLDLLKPMIDKAGTRVRTRLAIGTPLVLADPLHLQQVLVNIVQNASDAMLNQDPASRLIVIESSTAPESDTVEFGVRDAGPGFPEEVLLRPFEPFATTKAHGLGIGLALSRTMIEAQGGRFSIHNARRGAVVSFTLKKASPEGN